MKVFVAGATGAIGRPTVVALVAAGHEVTAVARSADKAVWLRGVGAHPVEVDLFDAAAVAKVVVGHDAVVNLATAIPSLADARSQDSWEANARLRREASAHLADAALAAGAQVLVQESVAFAYDDGGDAWVDEDQPLADSPFNEPLKAAEANASRVTAAGRRGVVLRFGNVYGPDNVHTTEWLDMAQRGLSPAIGPGDAYWPYLHTDDAATAVVAALEAPAGTYHVVDDQPLTRREASAAFARAAGRRRGLRVPTALLRAAGAGPLLRSQRAANQRLRQATGWAPRHRSLTEGLATVVGERHRGPAGAIQVALLVLAGIGFQTGLWAILLPRSFYDSYPGGGRAWVSPSGPFNEHLVSDVGAAFLVLGVVALVAACSLRRPVVRMAALTWIVFGSPHLLFHLTHVGDLATIDEVVSLGSLAVGVAVPALLVRPSRRLPASTA